MRRPCSRLSSRQRGADPRAARPVGHVVGGAGQRTVGIAAGELARHAREPRAEHERLHAGPRGDAGLQVLEHHARVRRHRARDVAHEHEPPRALGGLAVAALEQLAAVAQRGADRRPQVVQLAPARGAARAPGEPLRRAAGELGEQRPRDRALGVGVLGEVLLPQQLLLAPRGRHGDLLEHGRRPRRRGNAGPRQRRLWLDPAAASRAGRPLASRPKTAANASANSARSARDEHSAARSAKNASARDDGVDGGERAMGGEQLADADGGAPGAHRGGEHDTRASHGRAVARRRLRHRRALRGRGRARCPPAPSAPRPACPRGRPRRRARAARAPR